MGMPDHQPASNSPASGIAHPDLRAQLSDAYDALARQVDQMDTIEARVAAAEESMRRLESLSMDGIMAAITGTKAAKLDRLREHCEALHQEYDISARALGPLQRAVASLAAQVAAMAPARTEQVNNDVHDHASATSDREQFERALETGQSLLNELTSAERSCSNIARRSNFLRAGGPLVAAAISVYRGKVASGLVSQTGRSVRHFCQEVSRLPWDPADSTDAETLRILAQLESCIDPEGATFKAGSEAWLEVEVFVRSIVDDLRTKSSRG